MILWLSLIPFMSSALCSDYRCLKAEYFFQPKTNYFQSPQVLCPPQMKYCAFYITCLDIWICIYSATKGKRVLYAEAPSAELNPFCVSRHSLASASPQVAQHMAGTRQALKCLMAKLPCKNRCCLSSGKHNELMFYGRRDILCVQFAFISILSVREKEKKK